MFCRFIIILIGPSTYFEVYISQKSTSYLSKYRFDSLCVNCSLALALGLNERFNNYWGHFKFELMFEDREWFRLFFKLTPPDFSPPFSSSSPLKMVRGQRGSQTGRLGLSRVSFNVRLIILRSVTTAGAVGECWYVESDEFIFFLLPKRHHRNTGFGQDSFRSSSEGKINLFSSLGWKRNGEKRLG